MHTVKLLKLKVFDLMRTIAALLEKSRERYIAYSCG